ncbi:FecCD family ABC transporter permease [Angustibacter luteus]|uniref:FecCD family ABC transporter permease n=1 Tax=Angustibacter luteus TaxID=658456 RepID=A0ABW1JID4_9ACTN
MVTEVLGRPAASPAEVVRSSRSRSKRRGRVVVGALVLLAVGLFFADVLLGSYTVTFADLVRILDGAQIPGATFIVMEDKLPRAVTAVGVGIAFGVSGTIFQTMLRNPLASPDIIGISAGASASAVFAIVVLGAAGSSVSLAALVGGLAIALLIHLLARGGAAPGQRLILMGIGVAAMLGAVTTYLLSRSDMNTAATAFVWLNGSLGGSTWPRVVLLLLGLLVLLPATGLWARQLGALELGPDVASAVGVPVDRSRLALLVVAVLLTGIATAAAGPVAFVAFLAGPIARRLLRGNVSLVASALVGALIMLTAEFVATNLVRGTALPVGVVTGALGAPFLLYLLVSTNRVGRGG